MEEIMKILLICSKAFYDKLPKYQQSLQELGHDVFLPNCHDKPETEAKYRGTPEHHIFKAKMFRQSEETIKIWMQFWFLILIKMGKRIISVELHS